MTPSEFVQWLKDKDLFSTVKQNYPSFEQIFRQCLGVHREHVLIIGDRGYEGRRAAPLMVGCYLLAAKRLGLKYKLVIQEPKEVHSTADDSLIQSLIEVPEANVLTISISGKLGSLKVLGKSFRRYARSHSHRFASTISLRELPTRSFSLLAAAADVDYHQMHNKGTALKELMDHGKELRITAPGGTDLTCNIRGMTAVANTGLYTGKRSGGNIPAGEVYIAPRKRGVNGRAVIDVSSKVYGGTMRVKKPIVLKIEKGLVVGLSGGDEARILEETLEKAEKRAQHTWGTRRLGEIGLGINPKASLAGTTLINEKVMGTAHIALGSNVWFGGSVYAITHYDQVFSSPTVYIDRNKIDIRNI
jgi:hypothetical protein